MRDKDKAFALDIERWITPRQGSRKSDPHTYEHLTDEELSQQLRDSNQTLTLLSGLDRKSFDFLPEAQRIRALTAEERVKLRVETLSAATCIRREFRRRAVGPGKTGT